MEGTNQESSPLKLPLAAIVSNDQTARNATVSSARRGISIFSPTKTLDQPYNNIPAKLNSNPTSDSDPTHTNAISVSYQGGGVIASSSSRTPAQITPQNPANELARTTPSLTNRSSATTTVKYKECLKNHAANMGGHVLDGCGEFMPGGAEDSVEYLRCAACDCHRNFHRKVEGESQYNNAFMTHHHHHHRHRDKESSKGFVATTPTMMNFGGNNNSNTVMTESSSEDLNMFEGSMRIQSPGSKKRFRTKFSQGQKDKMHEFASKLGWRIQRQDDQEVTRFCNEVGVTRQVFKVWMHNNKQAMKRKSSSEG